jgi:hypothetical protein
VLAATCADDAAAAEIPVLLNAHAFSVSGMIQASSTNLLVVAIL